MNGHASGVCENRAFYDAWIERDPLVKTLMIRNINMYPFAGNFDNLMTPTMMYLAVWGRALVYNNQNPNRDRIHAITMAEALGPELAPEMFLPVGTAREELVKSVNCLIEYQGLGRMTAAGRATYATFLADLPANRIITSIPEFGEWPRDLYPAEGIRVTTLENAIMILYHLAHQTLPAFRIGGLSLIVHITVAVAKRGTISQGFASKVEGGINTDLGKSVTIFTEAITLFYASFSTGINDNTVAGIFERWKALIPALAMRLILTINQASGGGLISFLVIGEAMLLYKTFPWDRVALILSEDRAKYLLAVNAVGTNKYYGFKRQLGPARSTNYKNLAYVAKELLIKIGGKSSLNQYQGWTNRPRDKQQLDQLITDFESNRSQAVSDAAITENTSEVSDPGGSNPDRRILPAREARSHATPLPPFLKLPPGSFILKS
ncbi:hypothetical protein CBL_20283, partial [Carabus blaptoides fortunei]